MLEMGSLILQVLSKGIDHLPSQAEKDQANLALATLQQNGVLKELEAEVSMAAAQLKVDAAEAASGSTFVAGWRPFIGWACGTGIWVAFVLQPLWMSIMDVYQGHGLVNHMDTATLVGLVTSMLGMGGLRTFDKMQQQKASLDMNKFFASIRSASKTNLTQSQVDMLNKAVAAAEDTSNSGT